MLASNRVRWWPDANQKRSFKNGLSDALAGLIATATWGFVTGIAMVKSGLTESMATLMTLTVYAGSAQLTALPLIQAGAPVWLIFAAGLVVNLRFIIFSAALFPYFRHLPWWRRLLLGYFSTDIGFVVFMSKYADAKVRGTNDQLWYYLGTIVPGWPGWVSASLLGIFLGGAVPADWSLEFAATLALLAVVIPLIKSKPMIVCMLVAAVVAWFGQPLPLRLGLAAAVVAGVVAGLLAERMAPQRRKKG